MFNGIRLNSFSTINNELKTKISSSENIEFIYDALYEFEMQYVYNKDFKWRDVFDIKTLNFRNILERICVVFEKQANNVYYDSYLVLDKDDFTYNEQNEILTKLITRYLEKFDSYNRKASITRNLIFEVDVFIKENDQVLPVLSKIEDLEVDTEEYINLVNALKKDLRKLVLYYGQNTLNQFWTLFVEPDKYPNAVNAYLSVINAIYQFQTKVVQYNQSLIGPNTTTYSLTDPFIAACMQSGLMRSFNFYCFSSSVSSVDINLNDLQYLNDKQIIFTKQIYNTDYLSNELELMKNDVYCILNSLFPELVNYDLTQTEEQVKLQRVYNIGLKYNTLFKNTEVSIGQCNQITFYDDDNIDKLYILYGNETIIATPHYARTLYLKDNEYSLLSERKVNLSENDGYAVITEDNTLNITDLALLQNKIEQTLINYKKVIKHMINMLSSGYNKEIIDTNFYKLLRSIAYLIANYQYDLQEVKNNNYLNELNETELTNYKYEAKNESIYNNFGAIIDLSKKDRWTYEQYRKVVTAVYNACLKGPTKTNIEEAITTFTNYNTVIYELYKDGDNPIFSNIQDLDLTYRYAVEIHKALDVYNDADELYADIIYLLTMIKPAQALFLIYITFNENEIYDLMSQIQDDSEVTNILNNKDWFNYDLDKIFKTTDAQKQSWIVGNVNPFDPIGVSTFTYHKLDLDENNLPYYKTIYDEEIQDYITVVDYDRNTLTTLIGDPIYLRRIGVKRIRTFDELNMQMSITQQQYNQLTPEQIEFYRRQGVEIIVREV